MVIGDSEWLEAKARPILFLFKEDLIDDNNGRILTMEMLHKIVEDDPEDTTVAILYEMYPDAPNSEKLAEVIRKLPSGIKWVSWLITPWPKLPDVLVFHRKLSKREEQEIYALYADRTFKEEVELDYEVMFLSSAKPLEKLVA
jgi:hypothetical protein